jgi:hypothetical protein
LYKYNDQHYNPHTIDTEEYDLLDKTTKELFGQLVADFYFTAK